MTSPSNWADDAVLGDVKRVLIESGGVHCFADAAALFRRIDANGNGYIEPAEFRAALAAVGVKLSDASLRYLVLAFDKNRDGRISLDEFVGELVLPQLNLRRQRIVRAAFDALVARGAGAPLTPAVVRAAFDVARHPAVRAGRVAPQKLRAEFDAAFADDYGAVDAAGALTLETFTALFAGISAVVPSDDVFHEIVGLGFGLDQAATPVFSESARDWTATTRAGTDPLSYTANRPDDAYSAALKQLARSRGYDQSVTRRPQEDRQPKLPLLGREWTTTARLAYVSPAAQLAAQQAARA
jgi:hypothetical protein